MKEDAFFLRFRRLTEFRFKNPLRFGLLKELKPSYYRKIIVLDNEITKAWDRGDLNAFLALISKYEKFHLTCVEYLSLRGQR